tara:strand:+ start:350 stop:1036 length:687 start_codon:yes stop_codon:yes gene_type:complete
MDLKNKIVLVTGSSQGIGAATAIKFSKKGAIVAITYNSNKEKGEKIIKECLKYGECSLFKLDLTEENSIKNCVEKVVDKFGGIDILINNAGVLERKPLIEKSLDKINQEIEINLTGLIKITKFVLPYFQAQSEGVVINISSAAGKKGWGNKPVYCATKFAVRGFTQSMSKFYEGSKIKFYSVNPSQTATQMRNYEGVPASEVADIIMKTVEEKIKPDKFCDVDVENYL